MPFRGIGLDWMIPPGTGFSLHVLTNVKAKWCLISKRRPPGPLGTNLVGVHFGDSQAQHEAARQPVLWGGVRANWGERGIPWPRDFAGARYDVLGKGSTVSSIEPVGGGRPRVCRRRPKRLIPAVSQP